MIANPNSRGDRPVGRGLAFLRPWLLGACLLTCPVAGAGDPPAAPDAEAIRRAAKNRARDSYRQAQASVQPAPASAVDAWEFARACFDWAEFAETKEERATTAEEGIAAGRQAVALDPRLAAGHYYLAMNLGQLARTKLLGALSLVTEMEGLFEQARALDEHFDYAGADRCLGLLYRDAPGWPVSVGSRKKARLHLERSVRLAPDYFENRLNLLEAYVEWGDRAAAREEDAALSRLLPEARERFTGERWALSWLDWEQRWQGARVRMSAW